MPNFIETYNFKKGNPNGTQFRVKNVQKKSMAGEPALLTSGGNHDCHLETCNRQGPWGPKILQKGIQM